MLGPCPWVWNPDITHTSKRMGPTLSMKPAVFDPRLNFHRVYWWRVYRRTLVTAVATDGDTKRVLPPLPKLQRTIHIVPLLLGPFPLAIAILLTNTLDKAFPRPRSTVGTIPPVG
jgi:hypothetical protein